MKKLFFGFIILTLVFSFISTVYADIVYSPSKIQTAFETDKTLDGTEVTVTGEVNSTQLSTTKTKYYISLRDKGATGYAVYCEIALAAGAKEPTVELKSQVSVKGTVSGKFFKAIKLNKCSLVK